MRRLLPVALALLVALSFAASSAQPAITFVVKGNGWGHGIGLPQWGAKGYADSGRSHQWILAHFYPGTTLGPAGVARVRVILAEGRTAVAIHSPAAFTVTDGAGTTHNLSAGTHTVKPDMKIKNANGATRTLVSPATFKPSSGTLSLGGNAYRGWLRVHKQGSRVSAVNDIGLEAYLRGVVAWEMPSSWHAEALRAQAIIARTYGLVSRKTSGIFDLYADTRSQVYGGVRAETAATNAAVSATAGTVVRSNGSLAWTFYHSTSGGKTAAIRDVWAAGTPQPYLKSVTDAYSGLSPHHRWGSTDAEVDCAGTKPDCVWTGSAMKKRLGSRAPSGLRDLTVTRNASSRVAKVTASGSGTTTSIPGTTFQSVLGLRSSWYSIGVLRIIPTKGTIEWGQSTTLKMLTRSLSNVQLQRKRPNRSWETMRTVKGAVNLKVAPKVTTLYRLRSSAGRTTAVRINVKPQLRLASTQRAGSLYGTLGPVRASNTVRIQRKTASGWKTVATAPVKANGTWRAYFTVRPGVYRVRAVPRSGFVVGSTPALTIVRG